MMIARDWMHRATNDRGIVSLRPAIWIDLTVGRLSVA